MQGWLSVKPKKLSEVWSLCLYIHRLVNVLSPGRSRKLVRPEPVLNAQSCMYLFLKCILPARPLPKCVPSSLSHVGDADMEGKVALTVLC